MSYSLRTPRCSTSALPSGHLPFTPTLAFYMCGSAIPPAVGAMNQRSSNHNPNKHNPTHNMFDVHPVRSRYSSLDFSTPPPVGLLILVCMADLRLRDHIFVSPLFTVSDCHGPVSLAHPSPCSDTFPSFPRRIVINASLGPPTPTPAPNRESTFFSYPNT